MPEIVLMLNQKVLVRYLIFLMIIFLFIFQALLYGSCVSQKDNITKHACDKEFQALKACIRQAVSFLGDWSGSLFFLCLISLDIMLDFKPQTSVIMTRQSFEDGHKSVLSGNGMIKIERFGFFVQHFLCQKCPQFLSASNLLNTRS